MKPRNGLTVRPERVFTPFAATIWVLIALWVGRVTVFVRQRSTADFAHVDATAAVQVAITVLIGLLVFFAPRASAMWRDIARTSIVAFLAYYALCLVSSGWSPLPQYTAYRSVEYAIMILAIMLAIRDSGGFEAAERAVLAVTMLVIILTLAGHVRLVGFSTDLVKWHTNSYSAAAGMLFVYCAGELLSAQSRRKSLLRWLAVVGFAVLALGTSTASNIAALLGLVVIAVLAKSRKMLAGILAAAIVVVPLTLLLEVRSEAVTKAVFGGKSTEEVTSLKNRSTVWESYFETFLKSPVIGHGFAIVSTGRGNLMMSRPHNSVLSVLLGTGLVGLALGGFAALRLLLEALGAARAGVPGGLGSLAALLTALVNSLAMPLVFDQFEESSVVFVAFAGLLVLWVRRQRSRAGRPTTHPEGRMVRRSRFIAPSVRD
jgi:O-antigen ligase